MRILLVTDACGAGHPEAAERSHTTLQFTGSTLTTDTPTLTTLLTRTP